MPLYEGLKVFTGNSHPELANDICEHLNVELGRCDVFKFSNDQTFVRILENVREKDIFIVQSCAVPVNDSIMELLIMIDAFKRASAGRISAVIPYYGYGRSDKKDQPRVPITARLLANLIETAGADRIITIDLHAGQIQGFLMSHWTNLQRFLCWRSISNNLVLTEMWLLLLLTPETQSGLVALQTS